MLLMLRKCEAAERFETVPGQFSKPARVVAARAKTAKLIKWRNGWRLTEAGWAALMENTL